MDEDFELELGLLLATGLGAIAYHHNTRRLEVAHSLGIMPDYLHGLISFSKITGLISIKGVTAREETIKYTNPKCNACAARLIFMGSMFTINQLDPIKVLGGGHGQISYKINRQRFTSLWGPDGHAQPLVDFNETTGLIEFAGLDFDRNWVYWRSKCRSQSQVRPLPQHVFEEREDEEERESELWEEFRKWRARYKNSAFITAVWEPLETMSHSLEDGIDGDIEEIVSTAVKRHYKLIALFRSLGQYMQEDIHAQKNMEDEEAGHHLNPFAVIQARLGEVTGFNGFHDPSNMGIFNMMLPHWKSYFQEIKGEMAKLVEDFCPEAPRIARYLLERNSDQGFSVHLDAANFCPWLYFNQPQDDPYLNRRVGMEDDESDLNKRVESEEELDSSDSEGRMSEDD
jgi:hypothetical protein